MAADGQSLYFVADANFGGKFPSGQMLVQTDLSGSLLNFQPLEEFGETGLEDIDAVLVVP